MNRNDLGAAGRPQSAIFKFSWTCDGCGKQNDDALDGDSPGMVHDTDGSHYSGEAIPSTCAWCGAKQEVKPS